MHCDVPLETPKHLFMDCQYAKDLWMKYIDIFRAYVPRITLQEIVMQYRFPADKHERKLLCTLATEITNEIWSSRNLRRKEFIRQNVSRSVAMINAKIRIIHVSYKMASQDYATILALPSPICNEEGNQLIFALPEP